jgi:hypothetical protein
VYCIAPTAAADRRATALLRDIGPGVARHLASGTTDYSLDLADDIELTRDYFAGDPPVSDAIARTWRALDRALDPGADGDLVAERFRDNGDGTVTDITTGLQWMQCTYGTEFVGWSGSGDERGWPDCEGEAQRFYYDTVPLNETVSYAGYDDWRLPTIDELQGLVYCREHDHPSYMKMISDPAPQPGYNGKYWESCGNVTELKDDSLYYTFNTKIFDFKIETLHPDYYYASKSKITANYSNGREYDALLVIDSNSSVVWRADYRHWFDGEGYQNKHLYALFVRD